MSKVGPSATCGCMYLYMICHWSKILSVWYWVLLLSIKCDANLPSDRLLCFADSSIRRFKMGSHSQKSIEDELLKSIWYWNSKFSSLGFIFKLWRLPWNRSNTIVCLAGPQLWILQQVVDSFLISLWCLEQITWVLCLSFPICGKMILC